MLVELGVGDAYGCGFEFRDAKFVKANNTLTTYLPHQKGTILPGHYTDDTQMAVAVAEFLLSGKPVSSLGLADAFVEAFKRDPRQGYASGFYDLLMEVENGEDFMWRVTPHSNKGGGAMRAAPLGFLADPEMVRDRAMWQASLTHATKEGMDSAAVAALLVHFCRRGVPYNELHDNISVYVPFGLASFWTGEVGNRGYEIVRAAWSAIVQGGGSLAETLRASVAFSGDTDTVAAIAMAAASVHPNVTDDLPKWMYHQLEDGPFGIDYLRGLDVRLEDALPVPKPIDIPEEIPDEFTDMEEEMKKYDDSPF